MKPRIRRARRYFARGGPRAQLGHGCMNAPHRAPVDQNVKGDNTISLHPSTAVPSRGATRPQLSTPLGSPDEGPTHPSGQLAAPPTHLAMPLSSVLSPAAALVAPALAAPQRRRPTAGGGIGATASIADPSGIAFLKAARKLPLLGVDSGARVAESRRANLAAFPHVASTCSGGGWSTHHTSLMVGMPAAKASACSYQLP